MRRRRTGTRPRGNPLESIARERAREFRRYAIVSLLLEPAPSPLIKMWLLKPKHRRRIVERWCEQAKNKRRAWDQCDELLKYLIAEREDIPGPLRELFARWRRPRKRGRGEATAEYFVLDQLVRLLEEDYGFATGKAQRVVAIVLAKDLSDESEIDAKIRMLSRARKRVCDTMPESV